MKTDEARKELLQLMTWAVVRAAPGETFTLASGAKSDYYFDAKRVTQAPEAVPLIGQLVWEHAQTIGADAVGGLAAGSIPIADAAVAYDAFHGHKGLRGFYVREEKKLHGTEEQVYQAFLPDGADVVSEGRRVLIVDDVLTTGSSIRQAIEAVRARGAVVAGILVLIDRLDERSQALKKEPEFTALFESDEHGNLRQAGQAVLA